MLFKDHGICDVPQTEYLRLRRKEGADSIPQIRLG